MSRARPWFAVAILSFSGPAPVARAGDALAADLAERVRDLDVARGEDTVVAAQELWRRWTIDATGVVAESLSRARFASTRDPYERAYLQWLHAHSRRRLGDHAGASRSLQALGYADDWMLLGPFDNKENQGFDEAIVPELEDGRTVALARSWTSKGKTFSFRHVDRAAPFGSVELSEYDGSEGGACWYAVGRVRVRDGAPFDGRVSLGTNGAVKVFADGGLIGSDSVERGLDPERHAFPFRAGPGGSRIVVKVCHRAGPPAFMLRLADAHGEPTTRASIEGSPEIAIAAKRAAPGPVAPRDAGFLARIEARANASLQGARALRRYLLVTGGDDARGIRVRDLAERLLRDDPTAEEALARFSLAATRAERQALLVRAAALAKTADVLLVVDLLRIDLQREGLAPAEALPMARALEALWPDDPRVIAIVADVESQLGLVAAAAERTARAVERLGPVPLLVESGASLLARAGRREEAARFIALGLARQSDKVAWHRERLAWALAAGETSIAHELIARLDATTGHSANSAIELAQAEVRLGRERDARDRLLAAATKRPGDARFWLAIADLEVGLGRREAAAAALARGGELAPEDAAIRRRVEALSHDDAHDDELFATSEDTLRKLAAEPRTGSRRALARVHVTTVYPTGATAHFDQSAFQPLTEEAAVDAREYTFAYDAGREVVQVRRARVLRADGSVLDATDISQTHTDDPSTAMYSSQRAVIVHFPRISAGDVVEVSWRTDALGGDESLRDAFGEAFAMQGTDATRSSDWILRHPVERPIRVSLTGPARATQTEAVSAGRREVRVHAENLPAVAPEPGGPPLDELVPRVVASGFATWEAVGSWYRRFVAHDLVADEALRRRARTLGEGARDVFEKVRAVYDWVVQSTRYVALEFGVHGYEPYPTWEVAQRGWGDCKDKAALIVVLLRELGVEAELVLVRTNAHGRRYAGIPTHTAFDHAIAYVPALDLYLDGTADNTGLRELPWMDRGALGLRIAPDGGRLVTLPDLDAAETFERSEARLAFDARGSTDVAWSGHVEGPLAHDWRVRYGAEGTRKGRIEDDLVQTFAGLRLASVTGGSIDDRTRGPTLEARGSTERFVARAEQSFAVPVAPSPFLETGYAATDARQHTLWFARRAGHESRWALELPPGASVEYVPGDARVELPFARFSRTVERRGATFVVTTRWALERSFVEPEEYPSFREFCRQVDRAAAERLRWRVSP